MPQPCISCHGGRLRPLDRNGDFVAADADDPASQIGDVKARLQAFEVDTFEFSDQAPYRRSDVEEGLRKLNLAVYCTYPGSDALGACAAHGGGFPAPVSPADDGKWSGDFAREMLENWYGMALGTKGAKFSDNYTPDGWKPSPGGPPSGADTLFEKVVGPNCFVCHGKQGSELGTDTNASGEGKDVDFSSWDKFISHADDIERLVFDEGRMPLGLLNFQNFWGDSEKAELLASFIAPYVSNSSNFSSRRLDSNGNIIEPGERIIARAGPDRVTRPGAAITLDAGASLFADRYRWEIVSRPGGSTASLSNDGNRRTSFTADTDGEYKIRMTASNSSGGSSRSDKLLIVVDSALVTAPRALSFYTDISGFMGANCISCHSNGGSVQGIPVWWTGDGSQPFAVPPAGTPSLGLYEQVMARVNPDYVENSLLLKKPSGNHHYGGMIGGASGGFDTSETVGSGGRDDYDMFVNWIAEGAVCGGTAVQCP
jgi:mono/diheme cytochrome c family protein